MMVAEISLTGMVAAAESQNVAPGKQMRACENLVPVPNSAAW